MDDVLLRLRGVEIGKAEKRSGLGHGCILNKIIFLL
jgi:hypothetical protein